VQFPNARFCVIERDRRVWSSGYRARWVSRRNGARVRDAEILGEKNVGFGTMMNRFLFAGTITVWLLYLPTRDEIVLRHECLRSYISFYQPHSLHRPKTRGPSHETQLQQSHCTHKSRLTYCCIRSFFAPLLHNKNRYYKKVTILDLPLFFHR
jgi:hypothetical protein